MKSKVIKLADMKSIAVPDEMRKWHVTEMDFQNQLKRLAPMHPVETHPDSVMSGDSVLCACLSPDAKWNREYFPVYPGRGMLDARLENAVIGMKPSEQKTIGNVTLKVREITRRVPAEVSDELILAERIDGVQTLEQYRAYWVAATEKERRKNALNQIIHYLQQQVVERSELQCCDEELSEIARQIAKKQYAAMVDAGIDPTIPEDGVDFLTEEQALEKIAMENIGRLKVCIVNEYYATVVEPIGEAEYEKIMTEFEESMQKTRDELTEYAGEFLVADYVYERVFAKALTNYAETLLEV